MGMSTYVVGIKPPDEKWKKMKAAWDACASAGVPIPKKVDDFFGGEPPDERGVVVEIEETQAVTKYHINTSSGFEVDISKLPADVKIIRFCNSW